MNTQDEFDTGIVGDVKISNNVVANIAGLAALEVKGIADDAGSFSGSLSAKNPTKGVKIDIVGKRVVVDLYINILYGYSIPKTCSAIQDKVSIAIENMTGLTVTEVNVHIVGVEVNNK